MFSIKLSIRTKLIAGFLAVIMLGGLTFSYIGAKITGNILIQEVQNKVHHDLEIARLIYLEKLSKIKDIITFTSNREGIFALLMQDDREKLWKYLSKVQTSYDLDILTLTNGEGEVIVRVNNPQNTGDDLSTDVLVEKALNGESVASTEIIPQDDLFRESQSLASKAFMDIIPTPKTMPIKEKKIVYGMIIKAAAPILDPMGNVRGVLYGGELLNRDYEIVDKVKNVVYKGEKYKGKDTGTVTIFQGDLRIATNVLNESGERAIGTRASADVSQRVLGEGKEWTDRAFVVNDWYITAYEPIRNSRNETIGMLYVGTLEAPYVNLRERLQFMFLGFTLLSALVLSGIAFMVSRNIIRPLRAMAKATGKIAQGDLDQSIEVESKDEIGFLADSFNQMTIALKKANEELLQWGKTLEQKVEEKSKELEAVYSQLMNTEKLATVGRLSAGVAHELNNPLGGIIVYCHLLLEKPEIEGINRENLEKTLREAQRCQIIVQGLLDFSRQTVPELTFANINDILNSTLGIIDKQPVFKNIKVIRTMDPNLPAIQIDVRQMQQVFINIIINAAEAMDGDGNLSVTTRLSKYGTHIDVDVGDTGCGISPENLKKIYEPFFTTKPVGSGTGLGLAISFGIVKGHNGDIEVESEVGKGTRFTIRLPVAMKE